jgi:uroporphyrinogen decarboxylase
MLLCGTGKFMNSRERVAALLSRQTTDKIPFGLGGSETAGFHLLAYERLRKIIGLGEGKSRLYTFMTNAVGELDYLEKAGGDIVMLSSKLCPSPLWGADSSKFWKEIELWGKSFSAPDSWIFEKKENGSIYWKNFNWHCPAGGFYFDEIPDRSKPEVDIDELDPKDYNPSPQLPDAYLRQLENQAKWLYDNTEYSIACGEIIEDLQVQPGGFSTWWMYLAAEPEKAAEFVNKGCEAGLSQLKQLDQAIGRYCNILGVAHDFGDSRGVIIGAEKWREVYKPIYKKYFDGWKKTTEMKISLHSCGAISEIIPDLIECGLDILNPVQVSAAGMDAGNLKDKYGEKLIFWGGSYDSVENPASDTYETVYARVHRNISELSKGGGYIFAGVHNIPADVPEHHLKAMLDAYYDCSKLPALCGKDQI